MPPIVIPNKEGSVGIPHQWKQDIAAPLGELFLSSHPPGLTIDHIVAAGQTLAENTVVGFNADGEIVPAVRGSADPDDDIQAIGVLPVAITTPAGTPKKGVGIYRQGHFNYERLVWDTSYTTAEHKVNAFNGAPSPTAIKIGHPRTYTP